MRYIATILLTIFIGISESWAQLDENRRWFVAEAVSQRTCDESGTWSNWSEWEECNHRVLMDAYNNKLIIFTEREQIYDIVETVGREHDAYGSAMKYKAIDQYSDVCHIRIWVDDNSNIQIYVDKDRISTGYDLHDPYSDMYNPSSNDVKVVNNENKKTKTTGTKKDDEGKEHSNQQNVRQSKVKEIDVFNLYKPRRNNFEIKF